MTIPERVISSFARMCLEQAAKSFSISITSSFAAELEFKSKIGVVISISGVHIDIDIDIDSNRILNIISSYGCVNGCHADILLHFIDNKNIDSIEIYFQDGDDMLNWSGNIDIIELNGEFV